MLSTIIYYKYSYSTMLLKRKTIDSPEIYFSRSSRTKVYPFQFLTLTVDRDQTVLQRSKLRSCTAFLGEQPNPWNHLQLQDAIIVKSGECCHSVPVNSKPYMNISIHTAPTRKKLFCCLKQLCKLYLIFLVIVSGFVR